MCVYQVIVGMFQGMCFVFYVSKAEAKLVIEGLNEHKLEWSSCRRVNTMEKDIWVQTMLIV